MNYRLYVLGNDGRINRAPKVVECPNDAVALEEAKRSLLTCGYLAIEVWDGGRRVATVRRSNDRLKQASQ
jgi:hypothetical protein